MNRTQNKPKGERYIKVRVLFSYAIIFLLISSILYFTFDSFRKLTRSSDALAQPNLRISLLHDIVYTIYRAESNIRSYSLTEQEEYLNAYFDQLIVMNEMVDSLYQLAEGDQFIKQTIDSIHHQLLNKTQLLEQFIKIKRFDRNSVFYQSALDEILQVTEGEKKVREVTHQRIIGNTPMPITRPERAIVQDPENDNFFKRVRNFFSGSGKKPESREEKIRAEITDARLMVQEIRTDSIITVYHDTGQLREEIEKTMVKLMQSMVKKQQDIQRRENRILLEDKKVMDQIWEYITLLEDYEKSNAFTKAEDGHNTVNQTTKKIFVVVVASLIMILIFSWLFVNDINKSRFYKKQLIEEKAKAEKLVELKQRFMANISHEIRTPLNSILGFSEQLKKRNINHEQATYIGAIYQSSQHLLGLVNDILDFSKIEAGKARLEIRPVNIRTVTEEVYTLLKVMAQDKRLDFTIDISDLNHPWVMGDPLRIRQILLNIAGNAIKFTQKGYVKITVSDFISNENSKINHVRFRINDTGIGIPLADQEQIFEEFAQSDSRPSRNHGGTGLGLSISKRLVQLMDGTIELFSQPDKGTVFNIYIPLMICEEYIDVTQEPQQQLPDEISADILLVDDDKLNRLLFKSILGTQRNITVVEADNALSAISIMQEQKFDMIISDIQMPGMSGLEMVKQLRSDTAALNLQTPVIACTADVTSETLDQIKDAGMNDYVLKPLDEKTVIEKIISVLLGSQGIDPHQADWNQKPLATEIIDAHQVEKPYDLTSLIAFTGDDHLSVANILNVFLEDTKKHLVILEQNLTHSNRKEIYGVVHKMSNMFGLLKAAKANKYLRILNKELENNISQEDLSENLTHLIDCTKEVVECLETDMIAHH
jgi:signal transduction histidine kinase/CheY-like chemotaxis protein